VLISSYPRHEENEGISNFPFRADLSIASQLKLLAIHEYVDNSRNILGEIHEYLSFVESNPEGSINLQKASEKLGKFVMEADSWGFSSIYEVAQGLQMFLLNSGGRIKNKAGRESIDNGLAMLSALLERCETDFRWRLAIDETLEGFDREANDDEFNDLKNPW
jgi:hypothetical protein